MTQQQYFYGTGRRKSAIARVRLYPGTGTIVINGKPAEDLFTRELYRARMEKPLIVTNSQGRFNVQAKVSGGGPTGWADAVSHGIARALAASDEANKKPLRREGLLTRDPREKERKKPGLKRARKAPQYTKR
ncbi:MAG: 30S ribosomal protein S9 [Dehalococcoidia bacterium]|nr:30S ribosomal protein S9 [Dehalococcoidia bacterium]